jgi:hypothetical protein
MMIDIDVIYLYLLATTAIDNYLLRESRKYGK